MTENTRKKCVKWFWIIFSAPIALFLFMLLLVWAFADIPSFAELENPDSKLATEVIADDGQILTTFHIENRSLRKTSDSTATPALTFPVLAECL